MVLRAAVSFSGEKASREGSGILDRLRQVGALGDLPESSQVSFF